jgi:hypothetical protein
MKKGNGDLKQATKKQLEELRHAHRKEPKRIGRPPAPAKPVRRPTTKTLTNVYKWMRQQGLQVYGPAADLEKGFLVPGNMDYDVTSMLQLAHLRKLHPEGIPEEEWESDNEENAG